MQFLFGHRIGVPLATFALLLGFTTAGFAAPVIPMKKIKQKALHSQFRREPEFFLCGFASLRLCASYSLSFAGLGVFARVTP